MILRLLFILLVLVSGAVKAQNQILMPLPAQTTTFSGNVRGYWFTSPTCFTITGLEVPTSASSGTQNIAVVKLNNPPPLFSTTTNDFTVLYLTQNNPAAGIIPVSIEVAPGDIIGILGNRANNNSYATSPASSNINGLPVTLARLGMQFQLSSTAPQDLWTENGGSISRIFMYYDTTTTINVVPTWQGGFVYSFTNGSSSAATSVWDYGDGSPLDTVYNPTHTFPGPGTYTVCSFITGLCTSDTVCTQVIICPAPALADYSFTINYPTVDFTDNSQNTTTWQWDFGDGNTSTQQNPSHTYSTFGLYQVCLSVEDTCGGINTECKNISVCPSVIPVSLGSDVTACGSTVLNLPGFSTYTWSNGASTPQVTIANSGSYSVVVTDANGCSGTDTVNVTINPLPPVSLGNDIVQCGGPVILSPPSTNPSFTYLWNTGAGTATLSVTQSGTYTLTVTDSLNCSSSDVITVTINPVPTVSLGNDITVCQGFISISAQSGPGLTYLWSTGSTISSILLNAGGTYWVQVANTFGCTASDTILITMLPIVNYVELQDSVCISAGPITLTQGSPAGGTYSGPGVTGNIFDPQVAGLGVKNILYTYTDTAGCTASDTSQISVNVCTGLNSIGAPALQIYPNPSTGLLFVQLQEQADEITISDVGGRLVQRFTPASAEFTLDLREEPAGNYLLRVRIGNSVLTRPVVLRK